MSKGTAILSKDLHANFRAEAVSPVRDRAVLIGAARRHSRRVRAARLTIWTVMTFGLVAATIDAASTLVRQGRRTASDRVTVSGTKIVTRAPTVSGTLHGGGSFRIGCDRAEQTIAAPQRIEVFRVEATIRNGDKSVLHVVSSHGVIDAGAETMTLDGGIRIDDTKGMTLGLESAVIDMQNGAFKSADLGPEIENKAHLAMMALALSRK